MVIFFSGTGNSRFAASLLADKLGDELVDALEPIRSKQPAEYHSERPWIFVAPTYAWQLPRVFEAFIRNGMFTGSRKVYFVMTCGSEIGGPDKVLHELCRVKGMEFRGVLEVVMPENYIAMFSAPTAEEAAPMVEKARPVLEKAVDRILADAPFDPRTLNLTDKLKSGFLNEGFYSMFVKAKHFYTTADCNGCGLCEKLCPLNNIEIKGNIPLWGEDCTHCMSCICRCPREAIEYGRKSKGKPRYQCPEYRGK